MTDLIEITSGELTARINPLGAELWSLTDADGAQYMTDADPAFWTGHAPILFPIIGELNRGRYRLDDAVYRLPRHGFVRTSRFDVVEAAPDAARFRLTDSEATRAGYPFAFALEIGFLIGGMELHVKARVTNTGDKTLPFSLGFHPAFAWPLPGGGAKSDHRISFGLNQPAPIRRLDDAGLIKAERFPTPVNGHEFTPTAALFEADALIWDELASHTVTFGPERGPRIGVSFMDAPMLGIWQKPGAPFLCIEPWHGLADPEGFDGDFRDKPGIVLLPPGGEWLFRMDLSLLTA